MIEAPTKPQEEPCTLIPLDDVERAAQIYHAVRRIALLNVRTQEEYVRALTGLEGMIGRLLQLAGITDVSATMAEIAAGVFPEEVQP